MKRIKLRSLLEGMTEQAPQPAPQAGAPVPAPSTPQAATPEQPPLAPGAVPADTAPAEANPSDYDWTRDFRSFEDAKNKAEASSKKKLLDRMNKVLLNKKVTANASRGYGQPKTDYTIEKVKKVNVEFWYKDYVVILTDENDKKYFLTPGINIKVEGAGQEAPEDQQPADQAPEDAPPKDDVQPAPTAGGPSDGEEEPEAKPEAPTSGPSASPTPAPEPKPSDTDPAAALPKTPAPAAPKAAPAAPAPKPAAPTEPAPVDPRKKKKPVPAPVAEDLDGEEDAEGDGDEEYSGNAFNTVATKPREEYSRGQIQEDVGEILGEFVRPEFISSRNGFNVIRFLKGKPVTDTSEEGSTVTYTLEIPEDVFIQPLDLHDLQLALHSELRKAGGFGQESSSGNVDIQRVGRMIIITIHKTFVFGYEDV
jgi:hypothetical protein